MLEPSQILFMGLGKSAVLWYRMILPATHIGADWVGVRGEPPGGVQVMTGLVRGDTVLPRYEDYKVVVLQQVFGTGWVNQIHALKKRGIVVLYEVDDYLHGVAKQPHHDYARFYGKEQLRRYEMCMRVCDGIICSTEYLARRYAKFNRNVYVCRNGIDTGRYSLTRPERPIVNIGWAGATGHLRTILPWINDAVIGVMQENPDTGFVTIGQPRIADPLNQLLGAGRALGVPFAPLECYPAAMCLLDIALAPAGETSWYKAKSDLRWLEAAMLGIPIVADPYVYPEIEDGVTGFHARTPKEASEIVRTLVTDDDLRERVGQQAREHVLRNRTSDIAATQWFEVCTAAAGGYESVSQLRRA